MIEHQRASDLGWLAVIAMRVSQFWDWIDKRQIDAQLIAAAILYGSFRILFWSFDYATHGERPGIEVAAIIGAIATPWALLQSAAIAFIFNARSRSFETGKNTSFSSVETTKKTESTT